ncbi:MAG: LEA type 2 family protein [Calditrichaeota bacterium]|nr:LEA type 2 family protein [Calditrichota bacterium]
MGVKQAVLLGALAVVVVLLVGCAGLQTLFKSAAVKKPEVRVVDTKLASLSFSGADLVFTFAIDNPNPVGVTLAGFDYDLKIADRDFLQGKHQEELSVPAKGQGSVSLPLTIQFADLYKVLKSLAEQDTTDYTLSAGFVVKVPVLGNVRIPVTKSGKLPVLKVPKVRLKGLALRGLSLTSADLAAKLAVTNPNAVAFLLNRLSYDLQIDQHPLVSGEFTEPVQLTPKGEAVVELPVHLNFLQLGRSIRDLITGGAQRQYRLRGKIDLGSSLPFLKQAVLPFDVTGEVKIGR